MFLLHIQAIHEEGYFTTSIYHNQLLKEFIQTLTVFYNHTINLILFPQQHKGVVSKYAHLRQA